MVKGETYERYKGISTYNKDGRKSFYELLSQFFKLKEAGWIAEKVYDSKSLDEFGINLPSFCFKTKKKGKALWILSGIHGEEPAGPNAIAENIAFLIELGKKIPIVLFPLCNPVGYVLNWRYPIQEKFYEGCLNQSVSGCDYFLLKENGIEKRANKPESPESIILINKILELSKNHPPLITLDLHEDDEINGVYLYSQGKRGIQDPIANRIISILLKSGVAIKMNGKTTRNEIITNGIVGAEKDGSIDEFLAEENIIVNNRIIQGLASPTAIVIETPSKLMSLGGRLNIHSLIINDLGTLGDR